jgi:hypothetical protein
MRDHRVLGRANASPYRHSNAESTSARRRLSRCVTAADAIGRLPGAWLFRRLQYRMCVNTPPNCIAVGAK